MKFQIASALLALSSVVSATVMHVVTVGKDGKLAFCPEQITAASGDLVQFQFYPKNHSVVQGFFAKGCTPISEAAAGVAQQGSFSGFMPVDASSNSTTIPTFTITVNGTGPEWFYCSQGKHCQTGMVFAINPTEAKTLAGYKANCANATANIPPKDGGAPAPAPPAPTESATTSTRSATGSQTALPIQSGSMGSSTMSRTASWVVIGLAGCLTFMIL